MGGHLKRKMNNLTWICGRVGENITTIKHLTTSDYLKILMNGEVKMGNDGYKNNCKFRVFFLGENTECKNGDALEKYEIEKAASFAFKNGYHEFYEDLRCFYNEGKEYRNCHDSTIAKIVAIISRDIERQVGYLRKILDVLEERKMNFTMVSNDNYFNELCVMSGQMSSALEKICKLKDDYKYYTS